MKSAFLIKIVLSITAVLLFFHDANCKIVLPQLISNNMVLQRDVKLTIWGWASVGEKIDIKFKNKNYKTITSATGEWKVILPAMAAGGPFNMLIMGENQIELKDILIGDVWFFSGQSNMTVLMNRLTELFPKEIDKANYPMIRYFFVPTKSDIAKVYQDLPEGNWVTISKENILTIAAVPYFFGKNVYEMQNVPVGLINSSVGGTPAQAWISEEGLAKMKDYKERLANLLENKTTRSNFARPKLIPIKDNIDLGVSGSIPWYDIKYVPVNWKPFWLPGYLSDQGVKDFRGVVWFRKEINLTEDLAGKPATLFMGRIVDADSCYVNGVFVGSTSYQYPPRKYEVPSGLLKIGKNIITVKMTINSPKGGFVPDKKYYLSINNSQIDLRGDWDYKVGRVFNPGSFSPTGFSAQNEPTGLYNTMIAPAVNYKVKGFVWYQGESNAGKPEEYGQLLESLILDWRKKWGQGELPFLFAQLPNYMEEQYLPQQSSWAELRDQQRQTLAIKNTGMAVTIDLGEWNDIHPLNKKDVGERLAKIAKRIAYSDSTIVSSGPIFNAQKIEGDKIVLSFNSVGKGLVAKGDTTLHYFAIAGEDKRFVWAKAVIKGDKVVVWNDNLIKPLYVRYAWADNPAMANLYNSAGLPASPFKTDK